MPPFDLLPLSRFLITSLARERSLASPEDRAALVAEAKPLILCACVSVPVKTLPAPVALPEGTVNANVAPFKLGSSDATVKQPAPVHAAPEVTKPVPVSIPGVVTPRSKTPDDRFNVI